MVMSNPQNSLVMEQYAYFLDAVNGRTKALRFNPDGNSLQYMYDTIGCKLVECVQIGIDPYGNSIDVWCDEEGSWNQENMVHIKTSRGQYNLWGSVLILKSNSDGKTIGFFPGDLSGLLGMQVAYTQNVIEL